MANKRDPEKKLVGAWLTEEEIESLDQLCRLKNCTRADIFRGLIWKNPNQSKVRKKVM
jgi:hypothetical protein